MIAEPFAETLEPRGEREPRRLAEACDRLVAFVARVVGHAFDTRTHYGEIAAFRRP